MIAFIFKKGSGFKQMSERPGCQAVYDHSFSSEVSAELSCPALITVSLGHTQRQTPSCLCMWRQLHGASYCFSDLCSARAEIPLKSVRPFSSPSPLCPHSEVMLINSSCLVSKGPSHGLREGAAPTMTEDPDSSRGRPVKEKMSRWTIRQTLFKLGVWTASMGFCSGGERLGSTPSTKKCGMQSRSRAGVMGGKITEEASRVRGDSG